MTSFAWGAIFNLSRLSSQQTISGSAFHSPHGSSALNQICFFYVPVLTYVAKTMGCVVVYSILLIYVDFRPVPSNFSKCCEDGILWEVTPPFSVRMGSCGESLPLFLSECDLVGSHFPFFCRNGILWSHFPFFCQNGILWSRLLLPGPCTFVHSFKTYLCFFQRYPAEKLCPCEC